MTATTILWINVGILCCLVGLGVLLVRAICHLVLQWGERPPPWELVRLADGTVVAWYDLGTTRLNGVRIENSKVAKLILEAAIEDDAKEPNA